MALDSVEGLEQLWAWFAEAPEVAGVVLGTTQERVRRTGYTYETSAIILV